MSTRDALAHEGFAFVPADAMRLGLTQSGNLADWDAFADSWNNLGVDPHMADKGRYRKRRYAIYSARESDILTREAHQAHFQTLDYNPVNGGIERWFEPITDEIGNSNSLQTILHFCHALFGSLRPDAKKWHIEVHQFRIEAQAGEAGKPTPEGMHRDGRDYVLVLLIKRENIKSGITSIQDLEKNKLDEFILTHPFDAALLDDNRVYHGVTAVEPLDPNQPAYRDVLVVTFHAA